VGAGSDERRASEVLPSDSIVITYSAPS
jgi:hypothetical protein